MTQTRVHQLTTHLTNHPPVHHLLLFPQKCRFDSISATTTYSLATVILKKLSSVGIELPLVWFRKKKFNVKKNCPQWEPNPRLPVSCLKTPKCPVTLPWWKKRATAEYCRDPQYRPSSGRVHTYVISTPRSGPSHIRKWSTNRWSD